MVTLASEILVVHLVVIRYDYHNHPIVPVMQCCIIQIKFMVTSLISDTNRVFAPVI